MAAYTSPVSVMHIVEHIQHHPRPPISLDKIQVESFTENVTFLQEFLEGYDSHVAAYSEEADALEMSIADAAYAAEDVIESHIVDRILAGSTSHCKEISSDEEMSSGEEIISSIDFYQGLQKVIEDMELIKKEVMEIKEKMGVQAQLQRNSTPTGSLISSSTGKDSTMVGFDDVLIEVMGKLTRGQPGRQIIPIVGMGGIGKTTLARNIYQHQVVVQHFDILVWVTISQEYRMRDILLELFQEGRGDLSEMSEDELEVELNKRLSEMSEHELGVEIHKRLSGRRYLVIMDDIWHIQVWDVLKFFFPNNNNGSRIMLTTRLSNLASQVSDSRGVDMAFLDEDNSWNLFSKTVFAVEGCPLELEESGKQIVKNCQGLPLSIVVIGGLLAKSKHTQEYWEYIAKNLNSVVNSEDNESCLKILHMSYNHLPVYLKPCFLYMGMFSEDSVIRVSTLVKLWAAEGILKPISGKSLEEIGEEYFNELINRNLIFVEQFGYTGEIKYCNIHDLVRDLCLREAQKERFYNVTRKHSCNLPQGMNTQRRIFIPNSTSKERILDALQPSSLARSLVCDTQVPWLNFKLLRILKAYDASYVPEDMFQFVNLRYLGGNSRFSDFPYSVCLLWNIQTLVVNSYGKILTAPAEIWSMTQLRHVEFERLSLPDPPCRNVDGEDDIFLGNLQTLLHIYNSNCGEDVVKRIPNIKKLRMHYNDFEGRSHCLNNLERLHKLESFGCYFYSDGTNFLHNLITFPHSLKNLTLEANFNVNWEDMLEKVGSLPLLEKLKFRYGLFKGSKWETIDGRFLNLKFLLISYCHNLEYWKSESSHFPRLEHLHLVGLHELKEIPSDIGEIPTLQSIVLRFCSDSAIISAKKTLEEQEELGNEDFQARVRVWGKNEVVERLASPNFQVEYSATRLSEDFPKENKMRY